MRHSCELQDAADSFAYWFDFGDDWWHQVDVMSIDNKAPRGKYPKLAQTAAVEAMM